MPPFFGEQMIKYGVKLVFYGDQPPYQHFDMWIYQNGAKFETTDFTVATLVAARYTAKNPKGYYKVVEIIE